jgi:hypothetical protein
LCDAFEKTKTKFRTFEEAQRDMQKVLADFNANKLAAGAHHSEALEAKLDRYMRVNKDIDGRCTEALQQHGGFLVGVHLQQQAGLRVERRRVERARRRARRQDGAHAARRRCRALKFGCDHPGGCGQPDARRDGQLEQR